MEMSPPLESELFNSLPNDAWRLSAYHHLIGALINSAAANHDKKILKLRFLGTIATSNSRITSSTSTNSSSSSRAAQMEMNHCLSMTFQKKTSSRRTITSRWRRSRLAAGLDHHRLSSSRSSRRFRRMSSPSSPRLSLSHQTSTFMTFSNSSWSMPVSKTKLQAIMKPMVIGKTINLFRLAMAKTNQVISLARVENSASQSTTSAWSTSHCKYKKHYQSSKQASKHPQQ